MIKILLDSRVKRRLTEAARARYPSICNQQSALSRSVMDRSQWPLVPKGWIIVAKRETYGMERFLVTKAGHEAQNTDWLRSPR